MSIKKVARLGLMVSIFGLPTAAYAASGTWTGAGDALWSNPANWTVAPVPGTGDTATIQFVPGAPNTAPPNSTGTGINVDSAITLNSLIFNLTTNGAAISTVIGGTGSITFDDGGSISYLATNNGSLQTINRPMTLAGALTINNSNTFGNFGSPNNNLVFSSTITGSGPITITGAASAGSPVDFAANNLNYTGNITINSGHLRVTGNTNALGTAAGTTTLNGGMLSFNQNSAEPLIYANNLSQIGFGSPNLSGSVTVNPGLTLNVTTGGGNSPTMSGQLIGDATTNMKVAHGGTTATFTLAGTTSNTIGGLTTFTTSGTYVFNKTAGLDAVAGNLTVNNTGGTAIVRYTNSDQIKDTSLVTLSPTGTTTNAILRMNGRQDTFGGLASASTGTSIVESGSLSAVVANATSTLSLNVGTGNTYTFNGPLTNGDGVSSLVLNKSGAGTQILSGTEYRTGATTISGGLLSANGTLVAGSTLSGTTTSGSATVTFADTSALRVGQYIPATAGFFANGTYIVSKTATTVIMSANASAAGTTNFTFSAGSALGTGPVTVTGTGILGGTGYIASSVDVVAGALAPGNSAGTMTIAGPLSLGTAAALNYELTGTNTTVGGGVNDLITGVTNLTLDGTLNVTPLDSFAGATLGNSWRLFDYSGTLVDNTLALGTMPSLGAGLTFAIDTSIPNQVNLSVVTAIPEPGTIGLFACGAFLGVGLLRQRRRVA
jgi:fibronectin-binding autotransporter adhesin